MKARPRIESLTLGELIKQVYDVFGTRKARGILRLALKAHLIVIRDQS